MTMLSPLLLSLPQLDLHMSEVLSLLSLVAQYGLPRPATAFDLRERSKQAGVAVAFVMDERAPSTQINSGITEVSDGCMRGSEREERS